MLRKQDTGTSYLNDWSTLEALLASTVDLLIDLDLLDWFWLRWDLPSSSASSLLKFELVLFCSVFPLLLFFSLPTEAFGSASSTSESCWERASALPSIWSSNWALYSSKVISCLAFSSSSLSYSWAAISYSSGIFRVLPPSLWRFVLLSWNRHPFSSHWEKKLSSICLTTSYFLTFYSCLSIYSLSVIPFFFRISSWILAMFSYVLAWTCWGFSSSFSVF